MCVFWQFGRSNSLCKHNIGKPQERKQQQTSVIATPKAAPPGATSTHCMLPIIATGSGSDKDLCLKNEWFSYATLHLKSFILHASLYNEKTWVLLAAMLIATASSEQHSIKRATSLRWNSVRSNGFDETDIPSTKRRSMKLCSMNWHLPQKKPPLAWIMWAAELLKPTFVARRQARLATYKPLIWSTADLNDQGNIYSFPRWAVFLV